MTTVADLIEETVDHLYGSSRQTLTTLDGAVTAAATSLIVAHSDDIGPGSFVAIGDELIYVQAVTSASRTLTVIRGQRGTTAEAHADGALVDINPIFPRYRIRRALQAEIRSWPSDLYRVDSVDLVTASGTSGYDLDGIASDYLSILDVQLGPRSTVNDLAIVKPNYYEVRNADLDIYPSGNGIVFTGYWPSEARDLRVTVAAPFDVESFDDEDDAEDDIGLAPSQVDIPPMGAAWRLMIARDVKRSFGEGQGEPRRAEEIPPGFAGSIATFLKRTRDQRLADEVVRLRALHPIRRS